MALELAGGRKKQQKQGKYSIIDVDLFKPTKKKYPIYDFEEIRKNQLKEGDSSGDDERFHDREALELVRRLEEKYGRKMKKKRKQLGTEEDFIDKSAGYDLEDQFIDDSEAYDELIPSNMDTAQGGFYVNKGVLEFKEKYDTMDMSDISDDEDSPIKKAKKRIRVESEEEEEAEGDGEDVEDDEDQEDEEDDDDSSLENNTEPSEPASEAPVAAAPAAVAVPVPTEAPKLQNGVPPVISRPRMVGAPPTKKFAAFHNHSESPSQRAAKAILKKRLIGQPPMKNRFLKANLLSPVKHVLAATPGKPQQPQMEKTLASALKELAERGEGPTPSTSSSTGSVVLPTTTTNGVANGYRSADEESLTSATTTPGAPHSMVGNSPLLRKGLNPSPRKGLPALTDTLSNMIEQFKTATANLSAAGQKKRLQNNHVDQVIAIDEQCVKDGLTVHEKARVSHYIAEYCGIQRQSLYARVQKRKEDRKLAAMEGGPSSSATTTPAPTPQTSISSSSDEVMVLEETTTVAKSAAATKPPAPPSKPPTAAPTSTLQLNGFTEQEKQLARKTIDQLVASMSLDRAKLEAGLSQAQNMQQFAVLIQTIVEAHQSRTKAPAAAIPAKTTTPSTALVQKANSAVVAAKPTTQQQQVLQKSVKANTTPSARVSKISLEQVIRKLVGRPPNISSQKQDTPAVLALLSDLIKAFSNMLENEVTMQKTAYEHSVKANPLVQRAPMKFAWNTAFRKRFVDKFNEWWRVLSMVSGGLGEMHQRVYQFIASQFMKELQGYETLGGLIIQICRTSPDKALFLTHPVVKKKLDEEHIIISQQFVYEDGMKSIAHLFPTPAPVAAKSVTADDDIQFLDEHGNVTKTNGISSNATSNNKTASVASSSSSVVAPQPSTSSAPSTSSVTNGTHATPTRPAPSSASSSNKTSPLNALKNAALPDMNQIQQLIQMATASGNPQFQQAAILALQAQTSAFAQIQVQKQVEKEAEKQRIREEKERRQKEKEEKIRQAAEKKAEKMRQIEEKKRQMEEEKTRKAEEKARREEEERQKRLKEQEEKERRMQEERERQEREELERKRREEEERQRQVTLRIKQEEERARQLEAERQAQLEKEEQLAMQLLLEDDDEEEAEEERRAREEAEAEEEERVRKQEEAAAAARAAAMQREVKPLAHHSSSSNSSVDVKPTPQQLAQIQAQQQVHQVQQQQQNFVPPQAGFQSPGLHQQPAVPQSPKFPGGSPFMANQTGIAQSPQHNFNQPHQSPYAMQHQSPLHHVPQSPVNRHMVPNSPQQTAFVQQQQQQQQQNHFQQQQNGIPQGAQQPQALFSRPGPAFPQQPQQQQQTMQGQQQPFGGANAMMQQQQQQQLAMEQQKLALEQQRQQEFQRQQQQQQQQQEFQRQAEMQRIAEQQRLAQQQMQMRQQEQELRRQEEIRRQEEARRVEEMRRQQQEQIQRQRQQEQMQRMQMQQQQGPQHVMTQQQLQHQQMMLMMQQRQQMMQQQPQNQPQHQPPQQQQQQPQQFFQGNNYPGF